MEFRIHRSWQAFFKHKDLLCDRSAPIGGRLQMLTLLTDSSLFWCSGSLNLTSAQLSKLRGVQQKMIRWMLGVPRRPSESLADYMTRCASTGKKLMIKHGIEPWDATYQNQCSLGEVTWQECAHTIPKEPATKSFFIRIGSGSKVRLTTGAISITVGGCMCGDGKDRSINILSQTSGNSMRWTRHIGIVS